MAKEGEKIQKLRDFFVDSFNASELKMFLSVNGYEGVASAVNPSVGGIEYFFDVAQALARRSLIDKEFFVRLTRERPKKEGASGVSRNPGWLGKRRARSHRAARLSPRGCGRSTPTTPTSSLSSSPARATATACPRASGSGRPGSRTDPDETFPVGLIYGPRAAASRRWSRPACCRGWPSASWRSTSRRPPRRPRPGCSEVCATACPDLTGDLDLVEALAALRRGQGPVPGQKVLLVLDQFEQWLHRPAAEQDTELVAALRQCDGEHVQAIVMVRDDFWMAADPVHARPGGRAPRGRERRPGRPVRPAPRPEGARGVRPGLRRLPGTDGALTRDQETSSTRRSRAWPRTGKVISVRLALFAEMVKGKPWTPATLKEVGGTEGVGVTFLEETFSSHRPPEASAHQKAAQAVLKALLPESGTDIKGHMRSDDELRDGLGLRRPPERLRRPDAHPRPRAAADHADRPRRDSKPRAETGTARAGRAYYQLTHDYLVPSLRDWLTRKQRETRRGRAELRLAERSALWNAKPENRHLPSVLEWANIRLLTKKRDWTEPQRRMMRRAGRVHGLQGAGTGDPDRPGHLGRDRGLRQPAGRGAGRVAEDRRHDGVSRRSIEQLPGYRRWAGRPLSAIVVEHRERPRSPSPCQPCQPRLVARRRPAGRLSPRPSPGGLARRIAGDLGHLAEAPSGDRPAAAAIARTIQRPTRSNDFGPPAPWRTTGSAGRPRKAGTPCLRSSPTDF